MPPQASSSTTSRTRLAAPLVGARLEGAGHVEQPDPEGIAGVGRLGGPRVGEQPADGLALAAALELDGRHEVQLQEEPDRAGIRIGRERLELLDLHDGLRTVAVPLRDRLVAGVPVDRARRVAVEQDPALPALAPRLVPEAQPRVPADVATADLAGLAGPPRLEDALEDLPGGLVRVTSSTVPAAMPAHAGRPRGDEPVGGAGARGIAEPAVDRVLGRVQQPDALAALHEGGVLLRGHAGQDPPPSVAGQDGHGRHRGGGQLRPAGHGDPRRRGPERPAGAVAVERDPGPRRLPGLHDGLGHGAQVRPLEEGGADDVDGRLVLLRRGVPDLDPHGSDSSTGPPRARLRRPSRSRRRLRVTDGTPESIARVLPEGTRLVHIGPHKTGTTSLQAALFGARAAMLAQGVRHVGRTPNPAAAVRAVTGRAAPTSTGKPPSMLFWNDLVGEVRQGRGAEGHRLVRVLLLGNPRGHRADRPRPRQGAPPRGGDPAPPRAGSCPRNGSRTSRRG